MSQYVIHVLITHVRVHKLKIVSIERVITLNVAHQTTEAWPEGSAL